MSGRPLVLEAKEELHKFKAEYAHEIDMLLIQNLYSPKLISLRELLGLLLIFQFLN